MRERQAPFPPHAGHARHAGRTRVARQTTAAHRAITSLVLAATVLLAPTLDAMREGTATTGDTGVRRADATQPAQGSEPCGADEHHQFDFWIGEWTVRNPDGDIVGTNRIERVLGGCALHESWRGATGSVGHSYNAFDRTTGRWHQTWVDNGGLLLRLDGGLEGDAMVLTGETTAADGATVRQRISWQPRDDGRVRQHWQSSRDGGRTWTTVFDGTYERQRR